MSTTFHILFRPIPIAGLILAIALSSCNDAPPPKNLEVPAVDNPNGAQETAKLPEDVPSHERVRVTTLTASENQTYVMQGNVDEEIGLVAETYRTQADAKGWTPTDPSTNATSDSMVTLMYTKEGRHLNITLFRADKGTTVNITVSPG